MGKFEALQAAFSALGRALLVLDGDFLVLWASRSLERLVCPGAAQRVIGRPASDLLGRELFAPGNSVWEAVREAGRDEGRRAFLHCPELGSRLVSVTVAAIEEEQRRMFPDGATYLVVMRPAEDDHVLLQRGAAEMGFVARSPAMISLVHTIEQMQHSQVNVLITGESGTGKEVVARAIHANSPRRGGPFVAVNCAAIPSELLESELFGHVRGAFTGAVQDRRGRFELARGGTLFLDEIGDMPPQLQVKLLRVIQERTYTPVGESRPRELDARIVAATNVDLEGAIEEGTFREDLFYRLRVIPLHLLPLRERPEDIPPLARHLLARVSAREGRALLLAPDALQAIEAYDWPGNVRQLENALEHAVVLCGGGRIHAGLLPSEVTSRTRLPSRAAFASAAPEGDVAQLRQVLEAHQWRRDAAAKALGVSRTTLWRRMKEAGLA